MKDNLKRIKEMIGYWYLYRNEPVFFKDFEQRGQIVILLMEKEGKLMKIEKDVTKVDLFLDILKPHEPPSAEIMPVVKLETISKITPALTDYMPAVLRENKLMLVSLRDMLLDDMKKVRVDREYIPQAKQACNTANSIINLARLEIMMLRSE